MAYHTRDVHFYPEDTCSITEQADGKHLRVIDTRMKEIADIRLVQNDGGALVGQGPSMAMNFRFKLLLRIVKLFLFTNMVLKNCGLDGMLFMLPAAIATPPRVFLSRIFKMLRRR